MARAQQLWAWQIDEWGLGKGAWIGLGLGEGICWLGRNLEFAFPRVVIRGGDHGGGGARAGCSDTGADADAAPVNN